MSHPFPYIQIGCDIVADGDIHKTPAHCTGKLRQECKDYYKKILASPGFHRCPHSFASYCTHDSANQPIVFTAMRISGVCNKKDLSDKIANDDVPIYQKSTIERACNRTRSLPGDKETIQRLKVEAENQRKSISVTLHEVRKLNGIIKAESEQLGKNIDLKQIDIDRDDVKNNQTKIFHTSSMVSKRLDVYDFHANPARVTADDPKPIPIHRRFYKVIQCLSAISKDSKTRINTYGTLNASVIGWEIFEMLPFVLLENAIKYSPENQNIDIYYRGNADGLEVEIASIGPLVYEDELDDIFR